MAWPLTMGRTASVRENENLVPHKNSFVGFLLLMRLVRPKWRFIFQLLSVGTILHECGIVQARQPSSVLSAEPSQKF